jgi:2-isopropylmalate synthase
MTASASSRSICTPARSTSPAPSSNWKSTATFRAIRDIFPHEAKLLLFSVGAVTEGTDAQAKTTVRLEEGGKMVDGQGADTDTIVASARAYVHALNKLLVKRMRTEPAALSA